MKKLSSLTIALILVFTLFSTTGYAKAVTKKITAIFGSYVIKLNGKVQKTVTLANGTKVYIPINDVSTLTGATVKKSKNTYEITPAKKDDGIDKSDITTIKFYSEMQNLYAELDYLGGGLINISNELDIAFEEIEDTGKKEYLNTKALDQFNDRIDEYNTLIGEVESILDKSDKLNLKYKETESKHLNQILDLKSESIDLYQLAFDQYSKDVSSYNFDDEKSAIEKAVKAQELAYSRYLNSFNLIQNY